MVEPSVSVVIPNLNSTLIDRTIRSIKKQSLSVASIEIIVVGQDQHGLIGQEDRLRFIRTPEPVNPARARNIGIADSRGDVIFFIDSDCIAGDGWLQNLMQHQRNGSSVVGGAVTFDKDNYWQLCDNLAVFYQLLSDRDAGVLMQATLGSLNLSVTKEALQSVGGFDEKLRCSEDGDLIIRLRNRGYEIYFEPEALVHHHPNRDSVRDLLDHASLYGHSYPAFLNKYPPARGTLEGFLISHRVFMPVAAPLQSMIYSIKLFMGSKIIRAHWYTLPGVFLFFLMWHLSVFRSLRQSPA